jgi:acetyl esterase/lipase
MAHRSEANRHHGVLGRRAFGNDRQHAFRRRRSKRPGTYRSPGKQPDFTVLGYPVISMTEPWTHQGSKNNLLGTNPDPELVKKLSGELAVTKQTPPAFLFHTNADTAVPAENSVYYYLALRKAGVSAEMHIFENGPHGVGLANDDRALSEWSKLLTNWLRGRGVVK